MMARIREHMAKEDKGFTLIELLVVMIIIGILAAIAIPVFLNQRKKAEDSAAKADVSTLGKEIATWFVDNTAVPYVGVNNGQYMLGVDATGAEAIGNASANVELGVDGVEKRGAGADIDSTNWCVDVTNPKGDKAVVGYRYSAQGGLEEGECAVAAPTP